MKSPGGATSRKYAPSVILAFDRDVCGASEDLHGLIDLHKNARFKFVLVVCTGLSLSLAISFKAQKPNALPLDGSDTDGLESLRGLLSLAVDFIVSL
jgi:hypothetical protein